MNSEKKESENKNVENQGAGSQQKEPGYRKSSRPGKPYHKSSRQNRENRDTEYSRSGRKGRDLNGRRDDNRNQERYFQNQSVQNQQPVEEETGEQSREKVSVKLSQEEIMVSRQAAEETEGTVQSQENSLAETSNPEGSEAVQEQVEVIGVRFRQAGKIYYFDPSGFEIEEKSHVIVETARGIEYGLVVLGKRAVSADKVVQPLKPVIRVATPEDEDKNQQNREKEKSAFKICKEKILKHGLEMKLIDCEYTFDNNKVLFYFTADGRIDFRELVKDLAAIFKTRIELRQIGVRDETKICGGIGMCGRPLCCHTYLSEFIPVSIKMAKDQNLSLNPVKISGICGRLMCCLKNEEETYEWLNSKLPNEGDYVTTSDGFRGEVQTVNVLRQTVKVIITLDNDEKEVRDYPVAELKFKTRRKRGDDKINDAELRALENLEKRENKSKL